MSNASYSGVVIEIPIWQGSKKFHLAKCPDVDVVSQLVALFLFLIQHGE